MVKIKMVMHSPWKGENMLSAGSSSKVKHRHLPAGKRLRLREELFKQLRNRDWIFNRIENNLFFLIHPNGVYGVVVREEDIDWNKC